MWVAIDQGTLLSNKLTHERVLGKVWSSKDWHQMHVHYCICTNVPICMYNLGLPMQRVNARNVLKEEMQGSVQKTVKGSPGGAAWIALNSSIYGRRPNCPQNSWGYIRPTGRNHLLGLPQCTSLTSRTVNRPAPEHCLHPSIQPFI